jgi:hypothetical protein
MRRREVLAVFAALARAGGLPLSVEAEASGLPVLGVLSKTMQAPPAPGST